MLLDLFRSTGIFPSGPHSPTALAVLEQPHDSRILGKCRVSPPRFRKTQSGEAIALPCLVPQAGMLYSCIRKPIKLHFKTG